MAGIRNFIVACLFPIASSSMAGEPSLASDESAPPTIASAPTAEIAEAVLAQQARFAAVAPNLEAHEGAYAFTFAGLMVERVPLAAFAGESVLIVNTASQCGYTPQYEGLQKLHTRFKDKGFSVIGVPSNDFGSQEPGQAQEIAEFCTLNYGVTFPMAGKSVVTGDEAHPFYQWAKTSFGEDAEPRWNFHKILLGPDGTVRAVFPSAVKPTSDEIISAIESLL